MALMSPLDSAFLLLEAREHPMHVGGLSLLRPSGTQPQSARQVHEELLSGSGELTSVFRRRPARSLASFSVLQWDLDDDVDIDYHVRLLSVPTPGRGAGIAGTGVDAARIAARPSPPAVGGPRRRRARRRPDSPVDQDASRVDGRRVGSAHLAIALGRLRDRAGLSRAAPVPGAAHDVDVPGATEPRYWNGLRLEAVYPASIPLDGQAVNITTISSGGATHVGIAGCRRSVPHLQRLLTGLDESLAELE